MALTRFKRSLKWVRASVRGLTHTLHLPPAQAEIYDGPHPEWLRDVLVKLPNLQSLVVPQLPFFDHASLAALRTYGEDASAGENIRPSFTLRLLIANQCTNTTQLSLAEGLTAFPHLVFLDVSRTLGARDAVVLSKLRHMESLQILKLCGIQLRDDDIEILAESIGIRVRSLDVRSNLLTDHSLRTLLHTCFRTSMDISTRPRGLSGGADEDWPTGILKPDPAVLDEFRDESFDERYLRRLTQGLISRMPSEDQPHAGITHLYIADNHLTVEGVGSLVKSTRLHVLDVGAVDTARHVHRSSSAFSPFTPNLHDHNFSLPGAERLSPILANYACKNLTSLRVDHSLVTKNTSFKKEDCRPGICELDSDMTFRELDVPAPVYELPEHLEDRFELPGDSVHFVLSQAVGTKPEDEEPLSPPKARRNSIDAPEVAFEDDKEAVKDVPVMTATGLEPVKQGANSMQSPNGKILAPTNDQATILSPPSPHLSHSIFKKLQEDVRSSQDSQPHGLLPSMLPRLRSLTLTDVPCYDDSGDVVNALVQFIEYCASELELAKLQIDLESKDLDPATNPYNGYRPTRQAIEDIFALRKFTLEMSPHNTSSPTQPQPGSRWTSQTPKSRTKSSTEDADSEAFWAAQEKDFSFFDDDVECGLPSVEPGSHFPLSTLSEKIILPSDNTTLLPTLQQPVKADYGRDVVKELIKFRKDRRAAYEAALKQGRKTADGYWPGEVKVVRRPHGKRATVDYYGNYFEKGYIYR